MYESTANNVQSMSESSAGQCQLTPLDHKYTDFNQYSCMTCASIVQCTEMLPEVDCAI